MVRESRTDRLPYVVIGAGIAGLLAAKALVRAGKKVIVLEKSRGVGGRMATRRLGKGVFDHGAQFFTIRDAEFAAKVTSWQKDGLVEVWGRGFATPSSKAPRNGHPRYRGRAGMTTVPKALARDLDIRLGVTVEAVSMEQTGWQIHISPRKRLRAAGILLTPPAPQAIALLEAGEVDFTDAVRSDLQSLTFDPCIALLVITLESSRIPVPGGIQFSDGPVRWIADNHQKGISPDGHAITLHASPAFSQANWDQEDRRITDMLLAEAAPWIKADVTNSQIHRWRYSQPRTTHPERCLRIPGPAPLVLAGDAFGGPKIEGAALSGLSAARTMLDW